MTGDLRSDVEDGARLLEDLARRIRRFVVMSDACVHVVATWIVHCHAIDAFYTTGRLFIRSPEPECGKTMLLVDVMAPLLRDPIVGVGQSAPSLYRALKDRTPALLLDEIDKSLGRRGAADSDTVSLILQLLNSGYRRGQSITRCVGKEYTPTEFPTFAPAAFAGIHAKLDAPLLSRTIPIDLKRKLDSERIAASWRRRWCAGGMPI